MGPEEGARTRASARQGVHRVGWAAEGKRYRIATLIRYVRRHTLWRLGSPYGASASNSGCLHGRQLHGRGRTCHSSHG
eukprot:102462-Chlamydomonas_euryale.AAC.1